MRDAVVKHHLLERAARDVARLLLPALNENWYQEDRVSLWAESGEVPAGANYDEGAR